MLKSFWSQASSRFKTEIREGAGWYFLSLLAAPLVSLLMGPLVLRKVGLEHYAILAMAGYFFSLIMVYYDFGTYSHLVAAFSKHSPRRRTDLGHTLALRGILLVLFYGALALSAWWHPRKDVLYAFLAVSMIGLAFPSPNFDWYVIARRRYLHFFMMRISFSGVPVVLTVAWFFSPWKSLLWIAGINLASALAASVYLMGFLGKERITEGLVCLRAVSFAGLRDFSKRMFPLVLTQALSPYFLAYALVWFSMATPDKELVGAFGISYRVVIGFSALLGPLVLYMLSRSRGGLGKIPFRLVFSASLTVVLGLGCLGALVIWLYFATSKVNPDLLTFSVGNFAILMIAVFFMCLRTIHVSDCMLEGRYRVYFWIHFAAVAPVLGFSLLTRGRLSGEWVPWLACLPDLLATLGFMIYRRNRPDAAPTAALFPGT